MRTSDSTFLVFQKKCVETPFYFIYRNNQFSKRSEFCMLKTQCPFEQLIVMSENNQ